MTTELCAEDVIVRLSSPQISERLIISTGEEEIDASSQAAVGQTRGLAIAGVELGRRLLLAARAGDTATVLDLMAKGAPFTTDWLGTSPLHLAAANGHVETCGVLLRAGVSRDARTKVERTPLHLAAHAGRAAAAELLLQWGASPHARDLLRMTPLHWAAARGHADAARALLRAGADPRARCKFRKTPRCHAARAGHRALLALLDAAEADASAAVLAEQMVEEKPRIEPKMEVIQRIQEIKHTTKVKQAQKTSGENKPQVLDSTAGAGAGTGSGPARASTAAALLRQHGITLLPADDGSTVLNALQSGRTVVLSDAGKLMLKESSGIDAPNGGGDGAGLVGGVGIVGAATRTKGVVMRATPVRSPPRGVKVFALHNKLLSLPHAHRAAGAAGAQEVKFVQMPADAKVTPVKVPMKAKTKQVPRSAVKIIMNKVNFNKLLANANKPTVVSVDRGVPRDDQHNNVTDLECGPGVEALVGDSSAAGESDTQLRAQLRAAQAALADLGAELRDCRARLAHYEGRPQ